MLLSAFTLINYLNRFLFDQIKLILKQCVFPSAGTIYRNCFTLTLVMKTSPCPSLYSVGVLHFQQGLVLEIFASRSRC